MDRRSLLQGAAATTAVAGAALLGAQVAAADTSVPVPAGVPVGASAGALVAYPSGKLVQLRIYDGKVTLRSSGSLLGYQPLYMHCYGSMGARGNDGSSFGQSEFETVTPAGQLRYASLRSETTAAGVTTEKWTLGTAYGAAWQLSKDVTFDYGRIYRLTTDGHLDRYLRDSKNGRYGPRTPIFTGGRPIRTIATVGGPVTDPSLGECDALLATLDTGELREYRVQRSGTRWRSLTLRPAGSGWQGLSQMGVWASQGNRTIVAVRPDNRVCVYHQAAGGTVRGGATSLTLPAGTRMLA